MTAHGGIGAPPNLAQFRPVWRDPLHRGYEGYQVYTIPPPSSGGVLLEMLGMLDGGSFRRPGRRLAAVFGAADRGDAPGFQRPRAIRRPGLRERPARRSKCSRRTTSMSAPRARSTADPRAAPSPPDHGTSNLLVVDSAGNVVALTTTINTPFGAKITVPTGHSAQRRDGRFCGRARSPECVQAGR